MSRQRAAELGVLVLAVAIALVVVLPQTTSSTGLLDLRIYLGAAHNAWSGSSVYAYTDATFGLGSTYPPLWSVVLMPVSLVDVHVVEVVWTIANLLIWYGILRTLVARASADDDGLPVGPWQLVGVWAITVPSAAVWNTLNQGQINLLIWLLLVVDVRALVRSQRWAGAGIGLAAALKLHPALAVLLLLGARRWRAAVVACGTFVVATALAWAVRPADSWSFWTSRLFDTSKIGGVDDTQNNSLRGALEHLGLHATSGTIVLVVLGATIVVAALVRFRRALDAGCPLTAATVIGCLTALVIPISWTHHLVFLCVPLLLAFPRGRMRPANVAVLVAGAIFLVDPIGFGRMSVTSTVRTFVLLALLALAPLLIDRERSLRRPSTNRADADRPAADQPKAWTRVRASMTFIASR